MIWLLRAAFVAVLTTMVCLTVAASLDRGVFAAGAELWPDLWFRATLADAYFAFFAVYLWIAYKEVSWGGRLLWLVLVATLGSIAIAIYFLRELFRLQPGAPLEQLFLRRSAR